PRATTDDGYFAELTRAVFEESMAAEVLEAKWPRVRRAFSNFSVRDVADYLPDDVDRLMSDPASVKNLRKIEATIENAGEMLLVQMDHGSFANYLEGFDTPKDAAADIVARFRQVTPAAAAAFVERV